MADKRPARMTVPFSAEERAVLRAAATADGRSVAGFVAHYAMQAARAMARLEPEGAGVKFGACAYCGETIPSATMEPPPERDHRAWVALGRLHRAGCPWIRGRGAVSKADRPAFR